MQSEQEKIEAIEKIEKEARTTQCPGCGCRLKFTVSVQINGVRKEEEWVPGEEMPSPTLPKKALFTDDEQAVLERFKASGVFDSFVKAIELSNISKPTNLERCFLQLPSLLTKNRRANSAALKYFLPKEDWAIPGDLELWKCNYAEVIARDGEIVMFLPTGLTLTKETVKPISFGESISEPVTATNWIRTRFGYVAGKGLMLGELRQKNAGAFALADRPR